MPRIVVCTTDPAVWETLHRALPLRLERVDRVEDAARHNATAAVAAVVVDDRFLPVLPKVEHALRRFSPLFHNTVIMTAGEALTARWIGLLDKSFASEPLQHWMAQERAVPTPTTAAWQ